MGGASCPDIPVFTINQLADNECLILLEITATSGQDAPPTAGMPLTYRAQGRNRHRLQHQAIVPHSLQEINGLNSY